MLAETKHSFLLTFVMGLGNADQSDLFQLCLYYSKICL